VAQGSDLDTLQKAVVSFRDQRDWKQFHDPKDVAISLSLEASELLERFQWKTSGQALENKGAIEAELADVLYWVLLLGHDLQIDLASALKTKLAANAKKYPVQKSRGSSKKYTEL
jgi:NTP pyrophosphatase (non-canonical NTP hydrolase)